MERGAQVAAEHDRVRLRLRSGQRERGLGWRGERGLGREDREIDPVRGARAEA